MNTVVRNHMIIPNQRMTRQARNARKQYLEAYAYDRKMEALREGWLFGRNFGKTYKKGEKR